MSKILDDIKMSKIVRKILRNKNSSKRSVMARFRASINSEPHESNDSFTDKIKYACEHLTRIGFTGDPKLDHNMLLTVDDIKMILEHEHLRRIIVDKDPD